MTNTRTTTHTPGPWHVEASRSPIDGREHTGIWAGGEPMAGDTEVATVARRSDARLIALAPRMEQALRDVKAIGWMLEGTHLGQDAHNAIRAILDELDGEGTAT